MRRVLLLSLMFVGVASLAGCPSKPKNGECKSSADCAQQEGYGKVCVEGRCQECAADADCKDGFGTQRLSRQANPSLQSASAAHSWQRPSTHTFPYPSC